MAIAYNRFEKGDTVIFEGQYVTILEVDLEEGAYVLASGTEDIDYLDAHAAPADMSTGAE